MFQTQEIMKYYYWIKLKVLTILGAHYHIYGDNPEKEKPELLTKPCFRHLISRKHDKSSAESRFNENLEI